MVCNMSIDNTDKYFHILEFNTVISVHSCCVDLNAGILLATAPCCCLAPIFVCVLSVINFKCND